LELKVMPEKVLRYPGDGRKKKGDIRGLGGGDKQLALMEKGERCYNGKESRVEGAERSTSGIRGDLKRIHWIASSAGHREERRKM